MLLFAVWIAQTVKHTCQTLGINHLYWTTDYCPPRMSATQPGRVKSKHSCSTLLLSMSRMFASEEYNWHGQFQMSWLSCQVQKPSPFEVSWIFSQKLWSSSDVWPTCLQRSVGASGSTARRDSWERGAVPQVAASFRSIDQRASVYLMMFWQTLMYTF